jgi:hypothetical protein
MKLLTIITFLSAVGAAVADTVPKGALPPAMEPPVFDRDLPFPTSPFQPDLTPGYVLIEGDIQIPLSLYNGIIHGEPGAKSTFGNVTFWGSTVPFDFVTTGGGAVSPANQTAAINAMNAIAAIAGINFRPAVGGDANRIRFQNSNFNSSPVGQQGGAQIINMASWGAEFTICHEIFHSLGFWHEQSRSDRGTFVTINLNNICGSGISTACTAGTGPGQCCLCVDNSGNCISCAFNFGIQAGSSTYGPYDFDSVMHYGRGDFNCNGLDTITVNPPFNAQWQNNIGQRSHLSHFDAITCRGIYPFSGDRWLDRNAGGIFFFGTFFLPFNNTTLAGALAGVPSGGTLFIKNGNSYSAVGTYTTPVTIDSPNGPAFLGN